MDAETTTAKPRTYEDYERPWFTEENKFYKAHLAEFLEKYPDKELVIVGDKLVGVYDTLSQAIAESRKTYAKNTFCVKHVQKDEPVFTCPSIYHAS
jgi:hypothetical protein